MKGQAKKAMQETNGKMTRRHDKIKTKKEEEHGERQKERKNKERKNKDRKKEKRTRKTARVSGRHYGNRSGLNGGDAS